MKILFIHPSKGRPKKAIERLNEVVSFAKKRMETGEDLVVTYALVVEDGDYSRYIEELNISPDLRDSVIITTNNKYSSREFIKDGVNIFVLSTKEANTCVKGANYILQNFDEIKYKPFSHSFRHDFDFYIQTSDDMVMVQDLFHYLRLATQSPKFINIGAIQIHDSYTSSILTYPILTKEWVAKTKYIYHPDYVSMFADEDLKHMIPAHGFNIFDMTNVRAVEHHHFVNGKAEKDVHYERQNATHIYKAGQETFKRRKSQGFPI